MTDSKIFGRIPQPLSHTIDTLAPISKWLKGHRDVAGLPQEVAYALQIGIHGRGDAPYLHLAGPGVSRMHVKWGVC